MVQPLPPSITFSSLQKEAPIPVSGHSLLPPQLWETTLCCFLILGISYKWNHILCLCVYLLSLTIMVSRFIRVVACIRTSLIFYCRVDIYILIYPFISWWILGYFLFLAIRKSTAMNICVNVSV